MATSGGTMRSSAVGASKPGSTSCKLPGGMLMPSALRGSTLMPMPTTTYRAVLALAVAAEAAWGATKLAVSTRMPPSLRSPPPSPSPPPPQPPAPGGLLLGHQQRGLALAVARAAHQLGVGGVDGGQHLDGKAR